ncbi:hypothetical protein BS17DRAFT_792037, partial [Gyrodon lividus]
LFDDMQINSKWYYPFAAEKEILEVHGRDIVSTMLSRCTGDENASGTQIMLELGSGSLRKSTILLGALAEELDARLAAPSMSYLALDLQKNELVRTLGDLLSSSVGVALKGRVNIRGLVGTYKGSIRFVEKGGLSWLTGVLTPPKEGMFSIPDALHIVSLGNSMANFDTRAEAAAFLRTLPLRKPGDTFLMGLDHANDPKKIAIAYDDPEGYMYRIAINTLAAAGRTMGDESLLVGKWEPYSKYVENEREFTTAMQHATVWFIFRIQAASKKGMLQLKTTSCLVSGSAKGKKKCSARAGRLA